MKNCSFVFKVVSWGLYVLLWNMKGYCIFLYFLVFSSYHCYFIVCAGMQFFSHLVEDKTPGSLSYVEFLVHIHRQIQAKMSEWTLVIPGRQNFGMCGSPIYKSDLEVDEGVRWPLLSWKSFVFQLPEFWNGKHRFSYSRVLLLDAVL